MASTESARLRGSLRADAVQAFVEPTNPSNSGPDMLSELAVVAPSCPRARRESRLPPVRRGAPDVPRLVAAPRSPARRGHRRTGPASDDRLSLEAWPAVSILGADSTSMRVYSS